MTTKTKQLELPKEWIELVKEAMESNMTKEVFKEYLQRVKKEKGNH